MKINFPLIKRKKKIVYGEGLFFDFRIPTEEHL